MTDLHVDAVAHEAPGMGELISAIARPAGSFTHPWRSHAVRPSARKRGWKGLTARCGHRVNALLKHCERSPEDDAVAALPKAPPVNRPDAHQPGARHSPPCPVPGDRRLRCACAPSARHCDRGVRHARPRPTWQPTSMAGPVLPQVRDEKRRQRLRPGVVGGPAASRRPPDMPGPDLRRTERNRPGGRSVPPARGRNRATSRTIGADQAVVRWSRSGAPLREPRGRSRSQSSSKLRTRPTRRLHSVGPR